MKASSILILVVLILVSSYTYNNFFSKGMIEGEYENCNYNYEPFIAEIPYSPDMLTLMENNQFFSPHWGQGSYDINYSITGTEIKLSYKYAFGTAGYRMNISRGWFGKPKIMLVSDMNHYYEKVK